MAYPGDHPGADTFPGSDATPPVGEAVALGVAVGVIALDAPTDGSGETVALGVAIGTTITTHTGTVAPSDAAVGVVVGLAATDVAIDAIETVSIGVGLGGLRVFTPRPWCIDPRTGRPEVKVIIVDRDGTPVTALTKAQAMPLTDGVGVIDSWTIRTPRNDKQAKKILPVAREAQIWRGGVLMSRGPIGPGQAQGAFITWPVADPRWSLGKRTIGRIPKRQLLRNAGFTEGANGLAFWRGAYGPDSALKAAPTARVVEDDYAVSGYALELGAVDKVVTTKVDLESPAVFVPNKATYLKGGADKVRAVGKDIPEGATVRITGFTANDGTGNGLKLSLDRAKAVRATLAAMDKKFTFKLRDGWSKIDPTKRVDDGVVGGRGYYEQISGGLAKNRRVTIAFEGTQTATGHDQYEIQTLTVMQPVDAKVPLVITLAGDMRIIRWDGAPASGAAMRLILQDIVATKETVESSAVFQPNQATYLPGGEAKIQAVGKKIPEGATINLVGHTADNRRNGDTGTGLRLSLDRAKAAKATLQAMDKGFKFALPKAWAEIDPTQREDDGSVGGRGYYDPVAPNKTDAGQAKNRRVEIFYTARVVIDAGDDSSVRMNELTPRVRWAHYETSIEIPADGKTRTLEAHFLPPAGLSRWANIGLWPHDQLGFFDVDQAHIIRDLTRHVQDPEMGKGDLGIGTRTPATGVKRTKEYWFHERMPWTTAVEWYSSIDRGLDIDCEVTPTRATIVTHYPRQGSPADLALVHGGRKSNIATYRQLGTAPGLLASSIIMQADGSGAARPEAYARDKKALGGTLLEAVISAEDETPPAELQEGARTALRQSLNPRAGWEVTIHPDFTTVVLDQIRKGDTTRLVLPDEGVDSAHRMVLRVWDPDTDALTLTLVPEEG